MSQDPPALREKEYPPSSFDPLKPVRFPPTALARSCPTRVRERLASGTLQGSVAESVYALDSKSSGLAVVWVRFPPLLFDGVAAKDTLPSSRLGSQAKSKPVWGSTPRLLSVSGTDKAVVTVKGIGLIPIPFWSGIGRVAPHGGRVRSGASKTS